MKRILTIDPGFTTGWALWNDIHHPVTGELKLNKKIKYKNTEEKLNALCAAFQILLSVKQPTVVYIEGVEVWGGSTRSLVAVKRRKEDPIAPLFKLAYLVGGYCNVCGQYGKEFKILNFTDWGGQMTPEAVRLRVKRALKREYTSQHIYDAVAMGLSIFKKL